jgi:hypothetical protein
LRRIAEWSVRTDGWMDEHSGDQYRYICPNLSSSSFSTLDSPASEYLAE